MSFSFWSFPIILFTVGRRMGGGMDKGSVWFTPLVLWWRKSRSTWSRGRLGEGPCPYSHTGKLPCHCRCHASRNPKHVETRVWDTDCASPSQEVGRWSRTLSTLPRKRSPGGACPTGSLPGASKFLARSRSFGHWPSLCEKAKGNIKTYVNVSLKKLLLQRLEQGS